VCVLKLWCLGTAAASSCGECACVALCVCVCVVCVGLCVCDVNPCVLLWVMVVYGCGCAGLSSVLFCVSPDLCWFWYRDCVCEW